MPLTFDLTNVTGLMRTNDPDGKQITHWTTATESIIFYTMSCGIGRITEENAAEFYARMSLLEAMYGVPETHRLTAADVRQHIGLATNVSDTTRHRWLMLHVKGHLDDQAKAFAYRAEHSETRAYIVREPSDNDAVDIEPAPNTALEVEAAASVAVDLDPRGAQTRRP
jgi:hypothetical protein